MASDLHSDALRLFQASRYRESATLLETRCAENADDARSWFLLGACLHRMRELDRALAAFDRSIQLDPENLQAAYAVIAVLNDAGRPEAALSRCNQFLLRHPNVAQLHFSTGVVCETLGDFHAALEHYDHALKLDPRSFAALQNRGIVLTRLGRIDEAVESNRRLVSGCPDQVDSHYNLAESCLAARRYDEAILAAEQALRIDPGHALSRLDLGLALAAGGRIEEARNELNRVLSSGHPSVRERAEQWASEHGITGLHDLGTLFQPEGVFITMEFERLERCDWEALPTLSARSFEMIGITPDSYLHDSIPFKLLHLPLSPLQQLAAANRTAEGIVRLVSKLRRPERAPRPRDTRIRVGYMSSDFGQHPVGFLTKSIYWLHDREQFEIFGYALSENDGSDNFKAIAQGCDHFLEVRSLSLEQLAAQIASDAIDILVDLNGYTRGGRSQVLALRPAPVQVLYVGYPATLGGTLADWFIADGMAVPTQAEAFFAEKIARLPHSYVPASHRSFAISPTPARREEALPEGMFVLCAFHRHEKIDPVAFRSWMRILCAVPQSVLWLQQGPGETNLHRHARDAGVDPARLIFARHREHPEHLARQRLADLFLDTYCWNAHTTGSDALWCGVPLVTLPGEHLVSRLGASLLHGLGLDDLIAKDAGEYEALAIELATHPERLRALKAKLAQNRETHPLFDTARLVCNLERAYLEMWRIHESDGPPRSFDVEES